MKLTNEQDAAMRPPSPWRGSAHETRHRWELDSVTTMSEAASALRRLAGELVAAHAAGWELVEPMTSGHLLSARPSRRKRGGTAPTAQMAEVDRRAPDGQWRLRIVQEPAIARAEAFHATAATRTPVVKWADDAIDQVSGPPVAGSALASMTRQAASLQLGSGLWGVCRARVGVGLDLVADGSELRMHAVRDGSLVRTADALSFQHAADGASSLLHAAAAYRDLADEADAVAATGGHLTSVEDGFLFVAYDVERVEVMPPSTAISAPCT